MLIGGFQKSSLIDYPGGISAVVFTQGCNFRCPYCHNPELIKIEPSSDLQSPSPARGEGYQTSPPAGEVFFQCEQKIANIRKKGEGYHNYCDSEVLSFLKSRIGKLDAVVITGGEPTLHKDLPEFIKEIKNIKKSPPRHCETKDVGSQNKYSPKQSPSSFLIKLDTNGSNPEMLETLLAENLLDYVAMDIKAPIEKYSKVACVEVDTENIIKSIELLKQSNVEHEFRTTVVKSQLSIDDFEKIGEMIKGGGKYYLQKFVSSKTLGKTFMNETTYTDEEFELIRQIFKKYVDKVVIR